MSTTNAVSSKVNNNSTEELIDSLSQKLALNYLANSFNRGDSGHLESINLLQETNSIIFKENSIHPEDEIADKKIRNVLIIGAGAIYNSFNGIPMGAEIKRGLIESKLVWLKDFIALKPEEAEKKRNILETLDYTKKKILEEYENLTLLTDKDDLSFENLLFLLSKFMTEEELRKEIKKIIGFSNCNNLFYEIVAHLFKHSFIDVIVNFNFEEILDNVIKEEVGEGNYYSIISDGHTVKRENLFVEGRIKFPVYIKPHGTFSHSSSLRFTNQHYLDSPSDIKSMLTDIFSPYSKEEKLNLNIICVGFKLFESVEFKNILKNSLSKVTNPAFYIITNSADRDRQLQEISINLSKEISRDNVFTCSLRDYENTLVNNISPSLGVLFSQIFRKATKKFNSNFTPRSIAKHEVYSYFLYNKTVFQTEINREKLDNYYESSNYYKDKILVEIAFTFVRNLGVINILDLLNGRVGLYLESYNNKFKSENSSENIETIYSLISEFSANGDSSLSFGEEKEYQYSKNYFKLPLINNKKELKDICKQISLLFTTRTNKHTEFLSQLYEFLAIDNTLTLGKTSLLYLLRSNKLSAETRNNLIENCILEVNSGAFSHPKKFVPELFRLFQKSPNQNFFFIQNRINNSQYHYWESFSRHKLLQTNLSISYNFHRLFSEDKWNTLLAVLESGMVIKDCLKEKFNTFREASEFFDWFNEKRILITLSYQVAYELIYLRDEEFKNKVDNQDTKSNPSFNLVYELEMSFKKFLLDEIFENRKGQIEEKFTNLFFTHIGIIFIPYWEHNHHVSLFLNFKENPKDKNYEILLKSKRGNNFSVNAFGGFHMYRKGNSNSINPIHIRFENNLEDNKIIARDFEKLFLLYFLNVCRGIMFQVQISPKLCYNKKFIVDELTTYKDWTSEEFYIQMVSFMKNVKDFESEKKLRNFYYLKEKAAIGENHLNKLRSLIKKIEQEAECTDKTFEEFQEVLMEIR
ncbi:hypothetical protein [Emticicia fluvialis]|uniref:hypothetical protein n=1 Tax=Emticicia fluvialis TaxID=2974474 RepID=UPI002166A8C0|nr:hypothetical protein [Emticicia fluvialis]